MTSRCRIRANQERERACLIVALTVASGVRSGLAPVIRKKATLLRADVPRTTPVLRRTVPGYNGGKAGGGKLAGGLPPDGAAGGGLWRVCPPPLRPLCLIYFRQPRQ